MKKIAILLLLTLGAITMVVQSASAKARTNPALPPPVTSPQPIVSAT